MKTLWNERNFTFLLASAALLAAELASGQAFVNGAITGAVTDNSGAVVADVTLTLINLGTSAKFNARSNVAGIYQFLNLTPGQYRLEAEKSGFKRFSRQPIQILVNTNVPVDVVLQVGGVTETVTVEAAIPLLEPETSSLGQVIQTRAVNELPLNGRNPLALVALVPGVVPQGQFGTNPVTENPFSQGNVQINGGAANQSAAYWDGAPLNSSGYVNLLALEPSQDAVQEFKVQTDNLSAKYDRFAGGIISFSTKSGTNQVHGEAYEFLRNKVLNANNFFAKRAGIPVGAFTQNQFGGTFGGPLYLPRIYNGKDKTFFFVSFDGFRLREGLPLLFSVPTMAERNGDFSGLVDASGAQIPIYDPLTTCGTGTNPACAVGSDGSPIYTRQQFPGNIIPSNRIDPTAKILENLWAPPNVPGTENGEVNNWAGNASEGGDMNEFTVRLDQIVSDKQRAFGRYTINKYDNLPIDPFRTNAYPLQIGTPENTTTQQGLFDDSYTLSQTKVLDLELVYMRNGYTRTPQSLGYNLGSLGPGWAPLNNQVSFRTLPVLAVSGITDFSSQETGSVIRDYSDDWDLLPNFMFVHGKNTIEVGGDFRLSRFNYGQDNTPSGYFGFGRGFTQLGPTNAVGGYGFADFMLGAVDRGGSSLAINKVAEQQVYLGWYGEDTLHATRKLTFNLGFRYSRDEPFTERFNRISTFIANAPNTLIQGTSLPAKGTLALVDSPLRPVRTGFNLDTMQLGPRFGLAYALAPTMVFRGGYGIFWLPSSISWGGNNAATDPVNFYSTPMINSVNGGLTPFNYLSNPFPNGVLPAPGRNPAYASEYIGQGFSTQLPNQPYAYVQQWNLDLQKTLKGGVFVDVAYAGSKGTHLDYSYAQIDQMPDRYLSMGNALLNLVPNPYYGIVTQGSLSAPTVPEGQLLRPFPQYNGLGANRYFGNSSYNALQLKVEKRFSDGETLLVAYTNSKLLDDTESVTSWLEAAGAGGVQDWNNLKAERSVSSYDVPQRLVVSYVLALPFGHGKRFLGGASGVLDKMVAGWALEGVTTVQSGFPVFVGDSSNTTNSFGGGERPNYNPSAPGCARSAALSGSPENRLNQWFNTACFAQPAPFSFGDVPRTLSNVRWDGLANFDAAFIKDTAFGPDEKMRLQFRGEFFNLFNTPQFGPPGNSFGTTGFGVVSSQNNSPRLIQFGLKLLW